METLLYIPIHKHTQDGGGFDMWVYSEYVYTCMYVCCMYVCMYVCMNVVVCAKEALSVSLH